MSGAPFELFVALRFLREGRTQTALILAGASVGIAVLVFLSALIGGLQVSLISQTLGSQPHVVVSPPEETVRPLSDEPTALRLRDLPAQRLRSIDQWQRVADDLSRLPGVEAISPSVTGPAFAARGNASRSVSLRGVEPERFARIIDVPGKLVAGSYRLVGDDALVGQKLADDLGLGVGDKLRITTSDGVAQTFRVSGLFDLGNQDVNGRWVLVPLQSAQSLLQLVGGVSTLELRVTEIFSAEALAERISRRTGLRAESWMTQNRELLVALQSQSSSKSLIQFFVVVAVALGIASVLFVSVVQKGREIGILLAMGTAKRKVMRIFLLQGVIVGAVGALLGSLLGSALAVFFTGLVQNPDGSPRFPARLTPGLFAGAALVALVTGASAALVPARRAARLDPAVAIRNV